MLFCCQQYSQLFQEKRGVFFPEKKTALCEACQLFQAAKNHCCTAAQPCSSGLLACFTQKREQSRLKKMQKEQDLNPQPQDLESYALPIKLSFWYKTGVLNNCRKKATLLCTKQKKSAVKKTGTQQRTSQKHSCSVPVKKTAAQRKRTQRRRTGVLSYRLFKL